MNIIINQKMNGTFGAPRPGMPLDPLNVNMDLGPTWTDQ